MISDDAEMTALVREKTVSAGVIVTEAVAHEGQKVYEMYYEYKEGKMCIRDRGGTAHLRWHRTLFRRARNNALRECTSRQLKVRHCKANMLLAD